jgi:D-arabinose 1-dehydrogenase-like Zn-dependent alcohol dehydrogenase
MAPPLQVHGEALQFGRRGVVGWYSGHAKDSEETMAFAVLKGIRPIVETHPLADAENTFVNMSKTRYRAVLTT